MRKALVFAIAGVFLVVAGCGSEVDGVLPTEFGEVDGRVVNNEGAPLRDAIVRVDHLVASSVSGGHYWFREVPAGEQTVRASCVGYTDDGRATKKIYVYDKRVTDVDDLVLVRSSAGGSAP